MRVQQQWWMYAICNKRSGHVWDKQATVRWSIDAALLWSARASSQNASVQLSMVRSYRTASVYMWTAVCQQIDTWTTETFFDFDRQRTGGPVGHKCFCARQIDKKKTHTHKNARKERKSKTIRNEKVDNLCIHITHNNQCIYAFLSWLNRSIRSIHVYTRRHALFLAYRRAHHGCRDAYRVMHSHMWNRSQTTSRTKDRTSKYKRNSKATSEK